MDDATIHERIEQLVDEEHELWHRETEGDMNDETRQRLRELQIALDQMWDLLRQRKALRRAQLDPDTAQVRDPDIVENYRQPDGSVLVPEVLHPYMRGIERIVGR